MRYSSQRGGHGYRGTHQVTILSLFSLVSRYVRFCRERREQTPPRAVRVDLGWFPRTDCGRKLKREKPYFYTLPQCEQRGIFQEAPRLRLERLPTHGWGKQSVWLAASGSQTHFAGRSPHPLLLPNDRRRHGERLPEMITGFDLSNKQLYWIGLCSSSNPGASVPTCHTCPFCV